MRTTHIVSVSLLLASLVLVGASCGQKASMTREGTPTVEEQVASGPVSKPSTTISDACGNPYYPFKPGLAIAYAVTPFEKVAGDSDYTIRTVSVTGTTATIRAEMASGATADMTADCAGGSVALKGTSGLGAAAQGTQLKTTILSSSGTYMPADVTAGSTWSNSETSQMEVVGGSTAVAGMGPIILTTTEQSRAVGEESITVPAGTYEAIKVELKRTTTSEFSGTTPGAKAIKIPETISISTEWWVTGIGMVKTVTTGDDGTSTTEAKSVTGL